MLRAIALCSACLVALPALGQEETAPETLPAPTPVAATAPAPVDTSMQAYESAKRLRDSGIATTSAGLVLLVGGGAMFAVGQTESTNQNTEIDGFTLGFLSVGGGMFLVGGASMVLAGAPMWGIGQARMNAKRPVQLTLSPVFQADGAGVSVLGSF